MAAFCRAIAATVHRQLSTARRPAAAGAPDLSGAGRQAAGAGGGGAAAVFPLFAGCQQAGGGDAVAGGG